MHFNEHAASDITTPVPVSTDGLLGTGWSYGPQLDATGRYAVFGSDSAEPARRCSTGSSQDAPPVPTKDGAALIGRATSEGRTPPLCRHLELRAP
jgi:hypothetical protein